MLRAVLATCGSRVRLTGDRDDDTAREEAEADEQQQADRER